MSPPRVSGSCGHTSPLESLNSRRTPILFYIGSAGFSGGQGVGTGGIFSPEHYMKQFHVDHNQEANDLAKEEGFDN